MATKNEGVARRFFEELWNGGDLSVADELIATDHVHHVGGEELLGPGGVRESVTWLRSAFPDLRFEIDNLLSGDDHVAVRWTATGTHLGTFDDLQPTGRRVEWTGADWIRFRNDRIVEVWAFADGAALYEQLAGE